jgi:hypothetical protein
MRPAERAMNILATIQVIWIALLKNTLPIDIEYAHYNYISIGLIFMVILVGAISEGIRLL